MSEQEKNYKESMICLTPKPSKKKKKKIWNNWCFFVYRIQSKENIFTEKKLFKEKKVEDWIKKEEKAFKLLSLRRLRTQQRQ